MLRVISRRDMRHSAGFSALGLSLGCNISRAAARRQPEALPEPYELPPLPYEYGALAFHGSGHVLHTLYWRGMRPEGENFTYRVGHFELSAHHEYAAGANQGRVYASRPSLTATCMHCGSRAKKLGQADDAVDMTD